MRRCLMAAKRAALAAMLCAPAAWTGRTALAQVVFEDNFDGAALAPHWVTPPASHWDYDVSGGMLNVHRALRPSHPKSPSNSVAIGTTLPTPYGGDFFATMRVVWEAQTVPQVTIDVRGTTNTIAQMTYASIGVAFFAPGSTAQLHLANPVGEHEIGAQRLGSQLRFFLDGSLIGTLPDIGGEQIRGMTLVFRHAFPIPQGGPVRIDFVRVVPSPASTVSLLLGGGLTIARKRR